jgi:SAM-dependent methyltransferase
MSAAGNCEQRKVPVGPAADYAAKRDEYFTGARRLFVDDLPRNLSARLLEIGCGTGNTAAYALAQGKCGWSCGIELCPDPATEAATKMDRVIVGDIEQVHLDLPLASFDVIIMSEVLEHLVNPSRVLERLRVFLKPGALVLAGSPNVCHYSVLLMLLKGRWDYQEKGILDVTHLRWFTPRSYRDLFESAGYVVDYVGPASPLRLKARLADAVLLGRVKHLLFSQIYLRGHSP